MARGSLRANWRGRMSVATKTITAALVAAIAITTLVAIGSASGGSESGSSVAAKRQPKGLHVAGSRLLNAKGRRVQFHGINRAGTEYACIQGWGIFDGPHDAKSVAAMASWHV